MTDRRKSIFLPQVSRSSSKVDPGGPALRPGVVMMEELVYWTPFWSFTSISSTSFFSTLHCFSGTIVCSGITWIFIFSAVRTKPTLALTAPCGFWRSWWSLRLDTDGNSKGRKRISQRSPPKLQHTTQRAWAGEKRGGEKSLSSFGDCA